MAKKPSERRNYKDEDMELNLTPMMNLIAILIPSLLISVAFVEIAVINVSAPAIGSTPQQEEKPKEEEEKKLNLTITVTDKGYTLAGSGGVLGGSEEDGGGPTIPITEEAVSCQRYVGTRPPPRAKNEDKAKCKDSEEKRTFWVYDTEALQQKLIGIKEEFPDERRVIIAAESDIQYEAITDTMDASRDYEDAEGNTRPLFDEVVLSPGLS